MDDWYKDVRSYNYTLGPFNPWTSFSQLVWVASRKLGVGVSKCQKTGKVVVVADYDPPGNQPNTTRAFKKNILKPRNRN